jgi:hypothetical protein
MRTCIAIYVQYRQYSANAFRDVCAAPRPSPCLYMVQTQCERDYQPSESVTPFYRQQINKKAMKGRPLL